MLENDAKQLSCSTLCLIEMVMGQVNLAIEKRLGERKKEKEKENHLSKHAFRETNGALTI